MAASLRAAEPGGLALAAFLARTVPLSNTAAALAAAAACSATGTLAAPATHASWRPSGLAPNKARRGLRAAWQRTRTS
jgi:hypothetical protein